MPRIRALKAFLCILIPWLVLAGLACICAALFYTSLAARKYNGEYQTTFKQLRPTAEQLTEEYLTLNQQMFTLTEIHQVDGTTHYETFYADVLNTHPLGGQLQVKNVMTDQRSRWTPYQENAELIAKYQYATQPGAILNFQVLSAPHGEALCMYIYELSRLRCMNP
ncbi:MULTISPECIES: hypothetical protein [unclassified Pseudomonas]|uniref:hypothetical protein n=1 Tax=unclassified Pseudomonas TaxID=196821 RepID=UPI001032F628|nr:MULTISPECIES: hypothetical protein [unclassified Pseudomonas]